VWQHTYDKKFLYLVDRFNVYSEQNRSFLRRLSHRSADWWSRPTSWPCRVCCHF